MSEFRYSICEPTNPKILEKGKINSSEIMQIVEQFLWELHLEEAENAKDVFFKRPKMQKTWFGLREKINNNYTSELLDQSKEKTIEIIKAFVDNDLSFLERKFK